MPARTENTPGADKVFSTDGTCGAYGAPALTGLTAPAGPAGMTDPMQDGWVYLGASEGATPRPRATIVMKSCTLVTMVVAESEPLS